MIFGDPRWLWLLGLLPVVALLEWGGVVRADRALAELVGTRTHSVLLEQRRPGQRRLSMALRLAALSVLVLGAADPQWGRELVRRGATGSDIVVVVDVSASMDTRDVAPSRLEEARREALAVLDRLEGSRVGVVAFAGDAVRLCPLTLDRGAARLTVEGLSSGSVSDPGTDVGRALRLAARLMPAGRREEQAVVLWTDGEDLEKSAEVAAGELSRTGIRVFSIGVGTPGGDAIPVLDDQGRAVDVKRDENGAAVRSRLDESLLREVASRTHGAYFSAQRPGGELPRLLAALTAVGRSARGQRLIERPVSRFPWCAAIAAIALLADRIRPRRRRTQGTVGDEVASGSTASKSGIPAARTARHAARTAARAGATATLVALALATPVGTACARTDWARGDHAFRAGEWTAAESLYTRRLARGAARAAELNRATARAEGGKRDSAEADLARLAERADEPGRAAGYNFGTLLGRREAYDDALKQLRRQLERDPGDADARWNYEWVLRRKREEEQRKQHPDRPQSSGGEPKPSPSGSPQPSPSNPSTPSAGSPPTTPSQGTPQPQTSRGMNGGMDRTQAEQILNALDEQSRLQQGQKRVRVVREKRGRDW